MIKVLTNEAKAMWMPQPVWPDRSVSKGHVDHPNLGEQQHGAVCVWRGGGGSRVRPCAEWSGLLPLTG
jgi:hypothetical protein